ncbi:sugar ABC transporter ATP-binding protein [Pseudooceanicola algae]|uniref:Autoinducer 2 import ATP-binding protein LsrA n=1 Tax=Pseudooceanicola algae TaxID=1537215 RepID=A0A418SLM1_9RHOB|nr:sugar ABC transporter ATP-binding protein [Pseudooceanicola algae]QPM90560.1 Galactose/methyl galactoside import ATP-binding protein MglA [Pseudooceanicola algae]
MPFAVHALRKSYAGVEVLKGVDLKVADGEIHALLGANGAGKSTLIKCLSGAIQPDPGGVMIVGKEKFTELTPRTARDAGVAVIYQDPALAMTLDVSDNIFLGREKRFGPFLRKQAQRRETAEWFERLGIDFKPTETLSRLGNAEHQTIEIVRALSMGPKFLILDEPTAALSEREAEILGQRLLELKKQNLPMLYVTHRMAEVYALADRVTVLRGGKVVLSGPVKDFAHQELVDAIAGQTVTRGRAKPSTAKAEPALEVRDLVAPGIGPISFDVNKGEVLGIFGLVGSGRTELLESLFGARARFGGKISLDGTELRHKDPGGAVAAGLALVPSDRLRKSVIGSLSSGDNALLPSYLQLSFFGARRRKAEGKAFDQAVGALNLQPHRSDLEARRFSGGNQQKLVIARWLNDMRNCKLLMLDEPTQGVDVGARSDIYNVLRANAASGASLIVTSSEPEELMQLADRIIVLSHGGIVTTLAHDEISESRLLALAHGLEHKAEAEDEPAPEMQASSL